MGHEVILERSKSPRKNAGHPGSMEVILEPSKPSWSPEGHPESVEVIQKPWRSSWCHCGSSWSHKDHPVAMRSSRSLHGTIEVILKP